MTVPTPQSRLDMLWGAGGLLRIAVSKARAASRGRAWITPLAHRRTTGGLALVGLAIALLGGGGPPPAGGTARPSGMSVSLDGDGVLAEARRASISVWVPGTAHRPVFTAIP